MPHKDAEKRKQYLRRYAREHSEEAKNRASRWYYEHREEALAKQKSKYNPEQRRIYSKAYYLKNKEAILASVKKWQRDNPERTREIQRRGGKKYARTEKGRALNARSLAKRRARLQTICTLTAQEWKEILVQYHYRCAYCGSNGKLTQDHYIPLSKGGHHTKENVVPACRTCNLKKSARHPHTLF